MKKFLSFLTICFLIVFSLTGCFKKEEKTTIGLVVSTLNNPFFVTLKEGVEEQAKAYGYEILVQDSKDDQATELANVEDLISKGVDLIIINPTNSESVGAAVKAANKAKIPVITVDRGADEGEVVTHIASDNVAGGKQAGEKLLALVGEGAKVVELEGVPGTSAANDRGKGFNEAIKNKLDVVARQTANFNREQGLTVMENILQANKDIKGVFAHNDEMALGALAAIENAGLKGIIVIGFDATDDAVNSVNAGKMTATVAQQPKLMGQYSVENAKKVLEGKTVDTYIPVSLSLVEKK